MGELKGFGIVGQTLFAPMDRLFFDIYFISCTVIWTVQLFMCEGCENWGGGIEIHKLLCYNYTN